MRDVALPYRASVREERLSSTNNGWAAIALLGATMAMLVLAVLVSQAFDRITGLQDRLAASEACLANLHITMTRLDNPGPERGAVVASVGCEK